MTRLVDMEMSDDDQLEAVTPYPVSERARYPYGLRISLRLDDLDKLQLPIPERGDVIDLRAFAEVTCVSVTDSEHGQSGCVELQIQRLAVENEATESPDNEDED